MDKYYLNTLNDFRSNNEKKSEKKFDFKLYKKNTIKSLKDVEYFLNNFEKMSNYLKLYKLLK